MRGRSTDRSTDGERSRRDRVWTIESSIAPTMVWALASVHAKRAGTNNAHARNRPLPRGTHRSAPTPPLTISGERSHYTHHHQQGGPPAGTREGYPKVAPAGGVTDARLRASVVPAGPGEIASGDLAVHPGTCLALSREFVGEIMSRGVLHPHSSSVRSLQ